MMLTVKLLSMLTILLSTPKDDFHQQNGCTICVTTREHAANAIGNFKIGAANVIMFLRFCHYSTQVFYLIYFVIILL